MRNSLNIIRKVPLPGKNVWSQDFTNIQRKAKEEEIDNTKNGTINSKWCFKINHDDDDDDNFQRLHTLD